MRRIIAILAVITVLGLLVANATVYSYRWIDGTVEVQGADQGAGAACTGFYSSADQPGIEGLLPEAGTNAGAPTYGDNNITITTGTPVCEIVNGTTTYYLYDSISISIPITVGSWYLKDVYGFGYNGTSSDPVVYVFIGVDTAVNTTVLSSAQLIIYKTDNTTVNKVATLDLTNTTTTYTTIQLSPGEALQLDFNLTAVNPGNATFKVSFYVSQEPESPR